MSKVQVLLIDGDVIKERYDNFILIGLKKEIKRNNVEVLRSYDNVQFGSEFENLACNVLQHLVTYQHMAVSELTVLIR
jgi:hypothetical protein